MKNIQEFMAWFNSHAFRNYWAVFGFIRCEYMDSSRVKIFNNESTILTTSIVQAITEQTVKLDLGITISSENDKPIIEVYEINR
jgi:hypothetical protein